MNENDYTKYQLSKLLNCHASSVANWLSGTTPQMRTLHQIADLFGVSVEYLKGETDDRGQKEKPTPKQGELSNDQLREFMELLLRLSPEQLAVIKATAQALLAGQAERD